MAADLSGDFGQLMDLAGKYAVLKVRANADRSEEHTSELQSQR